VLSGCSSISYYGQSVVGHSRLMFARQSVDKLLANPETSSELKANLQLAKELRYFSVNTLNLPDNGSYKSYVELSRDFPVWTVVAADEFSVEAKTWCYPIIACAGYRGFYSLLGASSFAKTLQEKGFETTIGGAGAYSTLGWFDDPLLSSMMRHGVADFAETIFHELAHQVLYIKNNTAYNEAFATTVGEQGALLWLRDNRPDLLIDYQVRLVARDDFNQLLASTKTELSELYSSGLPKEEMRTMKQSILKSLVSEYEVLKATKWQGMQWFDRWFEVPVNNARLAALANYRDQVPEFINLLIACDSNFTAFFARVKSAGTEQSSAIVPKTCH